MKTKCPPHWIYYASNAYILAITQAFALMKAYMYLWTTTDGKASLTFNWHQKRQQGTKPESGKIANCSYSYYYSCKKFIPRQPSHDTRHCFMNNTNELCLLVSRAFWVRKINGKAIWLPYGFGKKNSTGLKQCVRFFITNHYIIPTNVLTSFHSALFKSRNYCHYK